MVQTFLPPEQEATADYRFAGLMLLAMDIGYLDACIDMKNTGCISQAVQQVKGRFQDQADQFASNQREIIHVCITEMESAPSRQTTAPLHGMLTGLAMKWALAPE